MLPKFTRSNFAIASGIFAALAGIVALIGWQFDSYTLKTFGLGGTTMMANSALSFIFSGFALILLQQENYKISVLFARIFSAVTALLGLAVLFQYVAGVNLGIDEFLFRDEKGATGAVFPGRMAPNTSLNFVLTGLVLFINSFPKFQRNFVQVFLLMAAFTISVTGFAGYILRLEELTGLAAYTNMPFNNSILFIVFCTGMFFSMFNRKKQPPALEYKVLAGLTFISVLIMIVSVISASSIRSLKATSHRVEHSQQVMNKLMQIESGVNELTSSDRGYLISSNEEFLEVWDQSKINMRQGYAELNSLLKEDPEQQEEILILYNLIEERIKFSELLVETFNTAGPDAAYQLLSNLKGKRISDEINLLVTHIKDEEINQYHDQKEIEYQNAADTIFIIRLNLALQLILMSVIFFFVKKDVSGRRKAEKALLQLNEELEERVKLKTNAIAESEKRYRSTLDNMMEGCQIIGHNWEYIFINKEAEKHNQRPNEELIGNRYLDMWPDMESTEVFERIKRCLEEKVDHRMENKYYFPDGAPGWFQLGIQSVPEGVLILSNDITDVKLAEIKLLHVQKRFRSLIEQGNDIITLTGKDGRIEYVSPSNETILGYSEKEYLGAKAMDYVHPGDLKKLEKVYADIFASPGKTVHAELRHRHKDGSYRWLESVGTNRFDDPDLGAIIASSRDITERKKQEKFFILQRNLGLTLSRVNALKKLYEVSMNSLFDISGMECGAIYMFDEVQKNLDMVYHKGLSKQFVSVTSHYDEDSPNVKFVKLAKPAFVKYSELPVELGEAERSEGLQSVAILPVIQKEKVIGCINLASRHLISMPEPLQRGIEIITSLFSNVMARINNEEKIRQINASLEMKVEERTEQLKLAKTEAENANLSKSEFLSRMSHELRTPLNSILGFAQLMEMDELDPSLSKGVQHIRKSGKHLLKLINEILDLSRIESGKLTISMEPVHIARIITEAMDIINPLAVERKVNMEFIKSPECNLHVIADSQKLKQVLLNLLNNAVKYNRPDGSVKVICSRHPADEMDPATNGPAQAIYKNKLRISVADSGKGIEKKDLDKLFIPFQRVGSDISEIEGTGLGLTVTKRLTEAMYGAIGVESKIGGGSTFWVELPECESPAEAQNRISETKPEYAQSNISGKLLYIEDNYSNIELVKQVLGKHRPGINLIIEMLGENAVNFAIEYKPDLILLDLDLPDLHGGEVLKRIRADKNTNSIPIIVLSADALPKQIEKLLKMGAKNYITKPFDVEELLNVIDKTITMK